MARALLLNPNSAQILTRSAWIRVWVGDADPAIDEFTRAIRLSPVDPEIGYSYCGLTYAFLMTGDYPKAVDYARRATHEMPRWVSAWVGLAVASIMAGNTAEAQNAAKRILVLSPTYSMSSRQAPVQYERLNQLIKDGLLKAGIPE